MTTTTLVATELQSDYEQAFQEGLCEKFGGMIGGLLGEALRFEGRTALSTDRLQAIAHEEAQLLGQVAPADPKDSRTLGRLRAALVASALLLDRPAVLRWATEGRKWCESNCAERPGTAEEWEWILRHPDQYILWIRELKHFLNQV